MLYLKFKYGEVKLKTNIISITYLRVNYCGAHLTNNRKVWYTILVINILLLNEIN